MSTNFTLDNGATNFNTGEVELIVNGQSKGKVRLTDATDTLGKFVSYWAKYHGIRTFNVYADGAQLQTSNANEAITARKVEIVAKDSRG